MATFCPGCFQNRNRQSKPNATDNRGDQQSLRRIPAPIEIKSALPSPPQKKKQNTYRPLKTRSFTGIEVVLRNAKIPGAHKIGAAIPGPRIAWWVPNPPLANPAWLKGPLGWCGRGSAAYWKSLQIHVISSAHTSIPIVTRGEGSFSYQGVSTRGIRHSPDRGQTILRTRGFFRIAIFGAFRSQDFQERGQLQHPHQHPWHDHLQKKRQAPDSQLPRSHLVTTCQQSLTCQGERDRVPSVGSSSTRRLFGGYSQDVV